MNTFSHGSNMHVHVISSYCNKKYEHHFLTNEDSFSSRDDARLFSIITDYQMPQLNT